MYNIFEKSVKLVSEEFVKKLANNEDKLYGSMSQKHLCVESRINQIDLVARFQLKPFIIKILYYSFG